MSSYKPTFLSGPEVSTVLKPLVEYLQQKMQVFFPELDFVFTDDEFVRDVPGDYKIKLKWFLLPGEKLLDYHSYRVTYIELIRPMQIQTETVRIQDSRHQEFVKELVPYLRRYVLSAAGTAEGFGTYTSHEYQFVW